MTVLDACTRGAQEGGDSNESCSVKTQNSEGSPNLPAVVEGVVVWTSDVEESAPAPFASYGLKE